MIHDGQNNIVESLGSGRFQILGLNVAFHYHRNKNGHLKQCNVFTHFVLPDQTEYLVVAYTRPHILDKDRVSKYGGREIAAARLAKWITLVKQGKPEIADKIAPRRMTVFMYSPGILAITMNPAVRTTFHTRRRLPKSSVANGYPSRTRFSMYDGNKARMTVDTTPHNITERYDAMNRGDVLLAFSP